ncbi:MAG: DUF5050 domain-containing protein [Lachnospiraceae bacterium]|nr:DUF5050 domain-containing protein [Lachnospiraceae bacterium]
MYRKWWKVILGIIVLGVFIICIQKISSEHRNQSEQKSEQEQRNDFGEVPYFTHSQGKLLKQADGYFYGYWEGNLCRYDAETLEKTVLFQTTSKQSGNFFIQGDYIYFLEKPLCSSLDGKDCTLYRVKCDGTEQTVLAEHIPNTEYDGGSYEIDIYDDILYLLNTNGNHYYRIHKDGSVTKALEEETLYGRLPEGYTPVSYDNIETLPYYMRNYGYLFVKNSQGELVKLSAEGDIEETLELPADVRNDSVMITNSVLVYACYGDEDTWYIKSLKQGCKAQTWLKMDPFNNVFAWDETGIYVADRKESGIDIFKADYEGNIVMELSDIPTGDNSPVLSSYIMDLLAVQDTYLYYNADQKEDGCIMRRDLKGEASPQLVDVYYENEAARISHKETAENVMEISENVLFKSSLAKVFLYENTEGERKINEYLEQVYEKEEKAIEAEVESARQEEEMESALWTEAEADSGWETERVYESYLYVKAVIDYVDDRYIGVACVHEEYWHGAAHGMYWSEDYVFDRITGKRVAITDVVENSKEEICSIVSKYVERQVSWSDYLGPDSILEPERFFLTKEGIGIHYDVYELACYAAGAKNFVIPYEEFQWKESERGIGQ